MLIVGTSAHATLLVQLRAILRAVPAFAKTGLKVQTAMLTLMTALYLTANLLAKTMGSASIVLLDLPATAFLLGLVATLAKAL